VTAIPGLRFDQLDPALADALRPRYERLGYLGGFFAHMAHQPEALVAFDAFTEACKRALPVDLIELVALTAATRLGNDYERYQHERLAVTLGLSPEWIAAVERFDDLPGLQGSAQRFVLRAVDTVGRDAGDALDDLAERGGPALAVAVALATGRYLAHAMIANACRLEPHVPSIFEDPA
jgi:alkylhydroperoxidase family enzyme